MKEEGNCLLFISTMLFKYCWIKLIVLEIFHSINQIVCKDSLNQDNPVCYEYLVSGTKYNVPDQQLNASSNFDTAKWGRLNTVYVKGEHIGGWQADNTKPPHYIEVRFNELSIIHAITTQGRNVTGDSATTACYVTKYHVYYKRYDAGKWVNVIEGHGKESMVFEGNNDSNSIRTNKLPRAVQADAVRILINESIGSPSMRFDVLGCPVSQEPEKDNKTSQVSVQVAVGVSVGAAVLGLSVLILIGIYLGRQKPFRSSAATTSIKSDLKMALSNEMSMDTVQEYATVMAGKIESVSPDPTYDNNQGVQCTHQQRSIKEERGYDVVSTPKRQIAKHTQEEQIYDHLDTGVKVPRLDDETYDHVKK
ncbi:hypothetical protein ACJMK2_025271 [Sinanodonta woodiana]|uniref:F5/8 type C domain-containing protein n=1 Tax=Sinanodonta woodiana TaxID=1069815 RepID=A0ABD3XHY4_SINWO